MIILHSFIWILFNKCHFISSPPQNYINNNNYLKYGINLIYLQNSILFLNDLFKIVYFVQANVLVRGCKIHLNNCNIFFLSSSVQSDLWPVWPLMPSVPKFQSSRFSTCFWVKFKFIPAIETDSICQNTQYRNIFDIKHLHL